MTNHSSPENGKADARRDAPEQSGETAADNPLADILKESDWAADNYNVGKEEAKRQIRDCGL